ncbi:DUF2497 domain-containing protein [Sphingomonas sp. CJ99]
MSDISSETSMEDILSSIKRIIAEEAEPISNLNRPRRQNRTAEPAADAEADRVIPADRDDILDLDAFAAADRVEAPVPAPARPAPAPKAEATAAPAEPILSDTAAIATSRSLEALSRMIVRPEVQGSDTLEGLVREMLRPMLRDWLDANLPPMVEKMVAKEIARIASRQG